MPRGRKGSSWSRLAVTSGVGSVSRRQAGGGPSGLWPCEEEMTRLEVAKAKLRRFWMGRPGRPMVPAGRVVTWRTFISWGDLAACAEGRERDPSSGAPRALAPALSVSSPTFYPWNLCQEWWERGVGAGGSPSPQRAHTSHNSLPQSCLGVSAWTPVTPQGKHSGVELPLATLAASPVCTGWWAVMTPKLLPPVCEQPASRGGW